MKVERVSDETGSHIEPPLQDDWSDLERLQWHAAVVECDAGVRVTIKPANAWHNGLRRSGVYNISYSHERMSGSSSAYTFGQAWTFLNGIELGARLKANA